MNPFYSEKQTINEPAQQLSKKILLAEDDIDDQELLTEAISQLDKGAEICPVTNGNKALNYLHQLTDEQLPQLIILDYNLPEVNGGEILELLQKEMRYQTITKIVWSTSDSTYYKSKCLSLGASAYLVKPSNMPGIKNLAQEILGFFNTNF